MRDMADGFSLHIHDYQFPFVVKILLVVQNG